MASVARVLLFFSLLIGLSACSLYRNKGRDQFEQRSQGQVRGEIGVSAALSHDPQDFSNCWIQNKDEALWSPPNDIAFEIHSINDRQMSVCPALTDTDEDQHHD